MAREPAGATTTPEPMPPHVGRHGENDVVFGGCSLQARRLQVTGSVACQSGFVQLIVKNGSDELWLTPDANGNISQEITGSGGDWYLSVEYAEFFRQRDIMQCLCEM